MELTIFLSKIWGPIILAIGLGIFYNRAYYVKIYRDLEKDTLAVLTFGMVAMAVGIVQIHFHNIWTNLPAVFISFMGWGLFLKGAAFVIAPSLVDKSGDYWADKNLLSLTGTATLIIGAYLSWVGYLV